MHSNILWCCVGHPFVMLILGQFFFTLSPRPPWFQCCGELCSSPCEIDSAKRLTRRKASKNQTTLKLGGGGGRKETFHKDARTTTQSKNKVLYRFSCEINSVTSRSGTVVPTQLRKWVYMSMFLGFSFLSFIFVFRMSIFRLLEFLKSLQYSVHLLTKGILGECRLAHRDGVRYWFGAFLEACVTIVTC